jgi:hypothetical protein
MNPCLNDVMNPCYKQTIRCTAIVETSFPQYLKPPLGCCCLCQSCYATAASAALPLRCRCATAALPLRFRCASAAQPLLPLRFRCASAALPLRFRCTPLRCRCASAAAACAFLNRPLSLISQSDEMQTLMV